MSKRSNRFVAALALLATLCAFAHPVAARPFPWLNEEQALFFPGTYFFHKGCDYFSRGKTETGIAMWKVAASWGQKTAQYDLGIAWFKGNGVAVDRPRGLAWLALAAERHDPQFEESLAAAWQQSTPDEHDRANAIWRDLRGIYADAVALRRAHRRYEDQRRHITGTRTGSDAGNLVVITPEGRMDGSVYLASMRARADSYFGITTGNVRIGPLTPLIENTPPAPLSEPSDRKHY